MRTIITERKNARNSKRVVTVFDESYEDPMPVEQQHKEKVDVNNIIKKYKSGHEITHLARKQGVYADLSLMTDYQGMLEAVHYAQKSFNDLPAQIRDRFQNDPEKLLEFLQDSKNQEEAIKLGLVEPKVETPKINESNDKKGDSTQQVPKPKASSTNSNPPKED